MISLSPEKLKLITQIEDAFKGDPCRLEEAITLHEAEADDDWLPKEKQLEARKLDIDCHWQDVPDEFMEKMPSPWSFLDNKGRRYYLPAYMRFCLKNPTTYATDMLILFLCPLNNAQGETPEINVEQIAQSLELSKEQCKVVYDFIHYFKSNPEIPNPEWKETLKEWRKSSEQMV